jgi:hypothetical protein
MRLELWAEARKSTQRKKTTKKKEAARQLQAARRQPVLPQPTKQTAKTSNHRTMIITKAMGRLLL